jgi:copper chaperone CopZ
MTCAYAVRVALKKYPTVDSVDVSLNKGTASVKLNPGNHTRPQELWGTIRKNGFTPKSTHVVVRGQVVGGQFQVAGSGVLLEIKGDAKLVEQVKATAGKSIDIEGTMTPDKDSAKAVPLEITAIRQ